MFIIIYPLGSCSSNCTCCPYPLLVKFLSVLYRRRNFLFQLQLQLVCKPNSNVIYAFIVVNSFSSKRKKHIYALFNQSYYNRTRAYISFNNVFLHVYTAHTHILLYRFTLTRKCITNSLFIRHAKSLNLSSRQQFVSKSRNI